MNEHKPKCSSHSTGEWSGSLHPKHPSTHWVCDDCGAVIEAEWSQMKSPYDDVPRGEVRCPPNSDERWDPTEAEELHVPFETWKSWRVVQPGAKNLVLSTEDLERLNQIIAHYQTHLDLMSVITWGKLRRHEAGDQVLDDYNLAAVKQSTLDLAAEHEAVKALLLKVVSAGCEVIE